MSKPRKYPEELKQRAVRLVVEAREQDGSLSLYAAVVRIGKLVGVHPDTLRVWCRQTDINAGRRPGVTTDAAVRIKELEREVRELKRANEILLALMAPGGGGRVRMRMGCWSGRRRVSMALRSPLLA